ncbi:MAG: hypothetical protein ACFFEY_11840 [Candidatus Thorarchaeota archaeon]
MLKTELNDFAERYFALGLRINKHINGYVEHYYGPLEIKRKVDLEDKVSLKVLLKDFYDLEKKLDKQGFESNRFNFFNKTFTAIETILKKINGEKIPYIELVEKLFDFTPKLYDEEIFYDLSSKAEEAYSGKGNLSQRMEHYVKKRKISQDRLELMFRKALNITRRLTKKKFPNLLPKNEHFDVKLVKDKAWGMYNWYLGDFKSRIEINTSDFHYWTSLLSFACHEGYPGHHTDRCVKDLLLYRNKGYFEYCISLIYTPEFALYEGMGEIAEDVIFSAKELSRILLENFCPNPETEDTLEILIKQCEIRRGFRTFNQNVAYHMHIDGWKKEDLISYCKMFKVLADSNIKSLLNFISNEIWGLYVLAYQGERIIRDKFGNPPTIGSFRKLITEQNLTSDLI